jgi:hypothetical protein
MTFLKLSNNAIERLGSLIYKLPDYYPANAPQRLPLVDLCSHSFTDPTLITSTNS